MVKNWKGGRLEAQKRYRENHREELRAKHKEWYLKNKGYYQEYRKGYINRNKEKLYKANALWQKEFWKTIRSEMIAAYGGKCSCCGETELHFLDLDHINNDGGIKRRAAGNGRQEMYKLKKLGWPKGEHQLLCSNCNQGKQRNGGICPHKEKNL